MIGRHLGARVSEVVDDHLVGAERRRALAHLASCRSCQQEVEEERRARRAASSLRTVGPPAGLSERILALSAEPRAAHAATAEAPWAHRQRRSVPRFVLAGSAVAGFAGLAAATGLYALGAPEARPAQALVSAGSNSPATAAVATAAAPAVLPAASSVVTTHEVDSMVVVVLELDGQRVTVVEARGRLALPAGTGTSHELAGHTVHTADGWWFAQVGSEAVAVHGDAEAVEEILAAFGTPSEPWTSRLAAGWQVVSGG